MTASRDQRALSLERLVRSDRLVAAVGLTLATALAWVEVLRMAAAVRSSAAGGEAAAIAMGAVRVWPVAEAAGLFAMWAAMMAAMMLPAAAGGWRRAGGMGDLDAGGWGGGLSTRLDPSRSLGSELEPFGLGIC